MPLETYRSKRNFSRTPEPAPGPPGEGSGRFVVQRHRATRLHYDLRLETGGVLVSWAVPRGPTLDPDERRLAQRTEDHPIEYLDFEGVIPKGEYGAGDMIVWDWGTFSPEENDDPAAALKAGELKFRLDGERLRGRFAIVQTGGRRDAFGRANDPGQWLLIHKRDEAAIDGWDPEEHTTSVKSGLTNDEVAAGEPPRLHGRPPQLEGEPDLSQAKRAPLPDFVPPMLATLTDAAFDDPAWGYEVKWDGYRVEAVIRGGKVRLWTRNRIDAATYFPDLADAADWIDAHDAVVDGEVVAFDPDGRPDFSLLQDRTGLRGLEAATGRRSPDGPRPSKEERAAIPIVYMAFDLLHLDGQSLLAVPLEERKRALRRVLRPHPLVRYASHVVSDGEAFVRAAAERGLEGIVAKRLASRYEPGKRSRDWLKVKLRREQELVVAGWLPGKGSHADLGSLIVAVNADGKLRHAGQVGSGLSAAVRRQLLAAMEPRQRDDSPLDPLPRLPGAHWVEPRIVIRAEFAEWTTDGLLRQPAFKGIEVGKEPEAVVREEAQPVTRIVPRAPSSKTGSGGPSSAVLAASPEELTALDQMSGHGPWQVAGREVRLTNLDKVIFPAKGDHAALTKRDLVRYYATVGASLVPYLAGRGLTLQRFPDGIGKKGFWQKDLPGHAPDWVARWSYTGHEGPKTYVVVDQVATLAWLAQEAAVELHPWTSRTDAPDRPSYALIDIDPGPNTTFEEVLVLARLYRAALEHLAVIGLPKVTGKRGIQVWVPVRPGEYAFADTRGWVESLSRAVGQMVPDLVSWEWSKRDRAGKARLDFTQNAVNKTLVAPYSARPAPGAPVSTPIRWEELDDPALAPDRWTVHT
ncbi:MAG: DNA ligase D, partial [Chloroflexota bacterium]|nr:DNA ligase D [Chloroflexota bacterium]